MFVKMTKKACKKWKDDRITKDVLEVVEDKVPEWYLIIGPLDKWYTGKTAYKNEFEPFSPFKEKLDEIFNDIERI